MKNVMPDIVVEYVMEEVVKSASKIYGKPLYFYPDHFLAIHKELMTRNKSKEGASQKYPAIMLLCDFVEIIKSETTLNADLQFLIVADSIPNASLNLRRKKVYDPVLRPVYHSFFIAIHKSSKVRVDNHRDVVKINRSRMNDAFSEAAKRTNMPPILNEYVDGIEIKVNLIFRNVC